MNVKQKDDRRLKIQMDLWYQPKGRV